ncbi:sigma-70 family RNA polymerase sigma factor [Variovorax flavidus]|uniref:sigma-70 family RNA polymerase sigma factor n=1 Tax=Variovorax flavidus TaxID=3053501 RepID=UPI0025758B20|nr:sigma-70 family RNA polymerase sigma factor [Variovorax sp. J2P1-59]
MAVWIIFSGPRDLILLALRKSSMNTVRPSSGVPAMQMRPRSPYLSVVTPHQGRGAMPTIEELNALARAVALHADREAFAALFKHFAPRVKSYLMRSGTAEGLAEELTQEAMVSVWRKAAMFDPDRASVSTWIFTIARNLRVDHFRHQGQGLVDGDDLDCDAMASDLPSPEEQADMKQREIGVRNALRHLPEEQAQVLRLSFFEEQPHARIASELGIPLGTVKSRVRLAVNHLRRLLDQFEP